MSRSVTMTLKEFYALLRAAVEQGGFQPAKGYYQLLRFRKKGGKRDYCPITAVYYYLTGKYVDSMKFKKVGKVLGLSPANITKIIRGADNVVMTNVRKQLLRAAKVKPTHFKA